MKYGQVEKVRLRNGKTYYRITFGPKDAAPIDIRYDGEKFSEGYNKLSDEQIREILSDII